MALKIDDSGTIYLYQGDTGEIVINGIPDDQNYKVYFAVQDMKRNPIGKEIELNSLGNSSVAIYLNASLTNELTVPTNKKYETYQYGVKICTPGTLNEDTLFISDGDFGTVNTMYVYPRKVEGVTHV